MSDVKKNKCECGLEFETYTAWQDCRSCSGEGEDDEGNRCLGCGGSGDHTWREDKQCIDCLRDFLSDDSD